MLLLYSALGNRIFNISVAGILKRIKTNLIRSNAP